MLLRFTCVAAMLALTSGCSPADPLNVIARSGPWHVDAGIAYADGPRHMLDVYTPDGARDAPVIVFFYGGNWQSGDRALYRFVAVALARRGIVAVVPDYRVYPQARFPEFVEDGAQAVAWVKANIGRFGGGRIFLMGHSAGAHIAAMLALDGEWLARAGLDAKRDIAGLIGIAGPYDFLPLQDDTLKTIFAAGDIRSTQPISFAGAHKPPALLVTGRADTIVDPGNSTRLAARLRQNGNRVAEKTYRYVGHLGIIGAFSPVLRFVAPVLRDVEDFVRANAGQAQTVKAPT